jgi:hypothetical protein
MLASDPSVTNKSGSILPMLEAIPQAASLDRDGSPGTGDPTLIYHFQIPRSLIFAMPRAITMQQLDGAVIVSFALID